MNRRRLIQSGVVGLLSPLARPGLAQTLLDSSRIILGFPAGNVSDLIARHLAEQLTGKLARVVLVENVPGAGGRLAVDAVRQHPADGSALLLTPSGLLTVVPHTYRKLSYRPFEDLTPISLVSTFAFGLAVGPLVPEQVKSVRDLARWCRANPDLASYASPAVGSPPHFVGEVIKQQVGFEWTHVPYRGDPLFDLAGGRIAACVYGLGIFVPYAADKRVRVLAVAGPRRAAQFPDVATFAEQDVAGLDWLDWFGLYAPGRPSQAVITRLSSLVRPIIDGPELAAKMKARNASACQSSTPDELDRLAKADYERWGPVIKSTGFVAD